MSSSTSAVAVLLGCVFLMAALPSHAAMSANTAFPCPTCGPPYPWWTGVELANATAPIRIEGYLAFTCPDCRNHWETIIKPLLAKYGDKISFVHQPFALPYQYYSYDATQAAYSVYRLLNNNVTAWKAFSDSVFNGQDFFFNAFTYSQEQVWTVTFAEWAAPLGVTKELLFAAMVGNITTANYDAWYQARMCRQHTFTGAPSFIVNEWAPYELQLDTWTLAQWEQWIDSALAAVSGGSSTNHVKGNDHTRRIHGQQYRQHQRLH